MADQRKKGKVLVSAYMPSELKAKIQAKAQAGGITMSEFLTRICVEATSRGVYKKTLKKGGN